MRPDILPRLVNGSEGDPTVYAEFKYERRALLFDVGDLHRLSARSLLKVTHLFISHTHVDHFIGFDHLLRLHLGREKTLELFGPPGLVENVEGKLRGYAWNLVENYPYDFRIHVYEFGKRPGSAAAFACRDAFRKERLAALEDCDSPAILIDEPSFRIRTVLLEHDIPCLCFSLEEKGHINVDKVKLEQRGFRVGPWITRLKEAVRNEEKDEAVIQVLLDTEDTKGFTTVSLGALKEEILRITRGQKIVYVTDAAFTQENAERIIQMADKADLMFCEAAFSVQDHERAQARRHLTAHQAGYLARVAGVDRLIIFHFSPHYHGRTELLYNEASQAFGKAVG